MMAAKSSAKEESREPLVGDSVQYWMRDEMSQKLIPRPAWLFERGILDSELWVLAIMFQPAFLSEQRDVVYSETAKEGHWTWPGAMVSEDDPAKEVKSSRVEEPTATMEVAQQQSQPASPAKRGRGRPKKNAEPPPVDEVDIADVGAANAAGVPSSIHENTGSSIALVS